MEDSKKKGISGIMNILKSSNNRLYKLLLILLSGICLMIVVWPANNNKLFVSSIWFSRFKKLVETSGIEPLTPCLQGRCSPS